MEEEKNTLLEQNSSQKYYDFFSPALLSCSCGKSLQQAAQTLKTRFPPRRDVPLGGRFLRAEGARVLCILINDKTAEGGRKVRRALRPCNSESSR